jgi:hypothetical protein
MKTLGTLRPYNVYRFYDVVPFRVDARSAQDAIAQAQSFPVPQVRRYGAEAGNCDGVPTWSEPARMLETPYAVVAR